MIGRLGTNFTHDRRYQRHRDHSFAECLGGLVSL
jgi:hypothetical protein